MAGDFSQTLVDKFQVEMAEKQAKAAEVSGLAELTSAISSLVETNQKLLEGRRSL
jgi:hypothetical protein